MYVQCDASQLEWRVLNWLANDQTGLRELNEEIDVHSTNQKAFNLPTRLISKKYLFRTIYRGSGWSFANDPDFMGVSDDPDFWDEINRKFYDKYKGIDKYHRNLADLVIRNKPICSPLGREWQVGLKENGMIPWTILTNYPVQGTGNDLLAITRISLRKNMNEKKMRSLLVSTVHDSIVADCLEEEARDVANLMYDIFDIYLPKNVKAIWNIDLPCKFPCEVKIGPNLKDMDKYQKQGIDKKD
jgi:DNA polymerase-1